jgi:hypothetical protein
MFRGGRKWCCFLVVLVLFVSSLYYFCTNTLVYYRANESDKVNYDKISKDAGGTVEQQPFNYDNEQANYLDESSSHLIWFMQISDLHLSVFHDETRIKDFDYFCKEIVGLIKPSVVLATGDLTDAKASDLTGSRQYENEWRAYHKVITENEILAQTVWLDVRGNHDNFDVPDSSDGRNFFR